MEHAGQLGGILEAGAVAQVADHVGSFGNNVDIVVSIEYLSTTEVVELMYHVPGAQTGRNRQRVAKVFVQAALCLGGCRRASLLGLQDMELLAGN